ncbi:hypothetical protein VP01_8853g1 [Puccinia sorghi]|uniref:Uncharacterized protein n=1 Tax=Puccinia sorghi TaxID=27349 RepID=A0A0L6U8C8_9BASI|nr:hypothetical protein VP01_8853g1 [Puccinia sorghi]
MNKQGRPATNKDTTGILLNEEKNASFPSNVILDINKKNKRQKTRKHNQMLSQLTPSEHALDEYSQDEIPEKPNQSLEKETPSNTSKGKLTESNYQNINPKSRATPKEAPNPFKSYEEYASKRDEGKNQAARDGLSFEIGTGRGELGSWDQAMENQLDWEKEDKEKDRKHIGKKYDLITQCVVSRKSREGIELLENLFK